ncbi:MAG: right-handed parallel beta-helix repeat-containing protein [Dehalococcoidales bacterium]|nr:right-handed parallel beta-helix repeat-containing protein [Dehalococcoidales bacterium]
MKSRFKTIWQAGLALVLALSLSLVTAVPAMAVDPDTLNVYPLQLTTKNADSTAEWSTAEVYNGSYSAHLDTGTTTAGDGDEARIVIEMPEGTTLNDITSISWWEYLVAGYPPHVDIKIDIDGDGTSDDALVFEYAYNDETHYTDEAPMPYGALTGDWYQTFSDDGNGPAEIDSTSNAWLSSGPPGPLGDPSFIYGTLAEWKAGTVDASVDGDTAVTALEIEVDNWVVNSEAYVDDIAINGVVQYGLIQDAIDSAYAGDTIQVAAGTYEEDLVIPDTKTDLELGGATGATIKGVAMTAYTLFPLAAPNIEILANGVKVHGFTIQGPDPVSGYYSSGMVIGASNVEIYDNSFEVTNASTTDDISQGMQTYHEVAVPGVDISGLNIHDNTFTNHGTGTVGFEAIYINRDAETSTVNITDNQFTGDVFRAITTERSKTTISGNSIITDILTTIAWQGILVRDSSLGFGTQDTVTLTGNTVKGSGTGKGFDQGILIGTSSQPLTNISVTNNTVQTNVVGIKVRSSANGVVVNNNNIDGNTTYGVENTDTANTLDATNNWWGNASGALYAGALYDIAYGDTVSNYVDYEPWLLAEVEEGVTPTTYEKTLALKDGWTLVSPDKEVTTGTDWTATVAYKYTAGTGYAQVTLATQLTSVDAYYLKTDGGGGVGINYSTAAPGVVTKTLGEGWNIISAAGETDAYTLLSQLRNVTIGTQQGVGITNLVSQGNYNQFTESLSVPLATDGDWDDWGGDILSQFDGYWVYMNAGKTFGVIPD